MTSTPPDWQAIQSEYEQGSPLRSLAAKYDVSKTTLIRKRNSEGWTKDRTAGPRTTNQAHVDTHLTPKKDLSTKDRQRLFLDAFSEHANVLVSARAAEISRQIVYEWLEHDEDFSFAYNQAKEDAKDVIRAEIYRRGHDGVEESVYQQGVFVHTVRKYSDTLLIFHAKMLMPEYREKTTLDVASADTLAQALHALSDEQYAQFKQWVANPKGER